MLYCLRSELKRQRDRYREMEIQSDINRGGKKKNQIDEGKDQQTCEILAYAEVR